MDETAWYGPTTFVRTIAAAHQQDTHLRLIADRGFAATITITITESAGFRGVTPKPRAFLRMCMAVVRVVIVYSIKRVERPEHTEDHDIDRDRRMRMRRGVVLPRVVLSGHKSCTSFVSVSITLRISGRAVFGQVLALTPNPFSRARERGDRLSCHARLPSPLEGEGLGVRG